MKTTPEEARSKVCSESIRPKEHDLMNKDRFCQADDCMAWRWAKPNISPATGYCGKAGKPE